MSPIPPPLGFVPPSEDWDDSFDISPTAQNFALPSSSASSSSSSSRKSLNIHSPLRQSFPTTPLDQHQAEDDDFDFDLPDSFPALESPRLSLSKFDGPKRRPSLSLSTIKLHDISKTVIGTGPNGVGTVTRLGGTSKTSTSTFSTGTLRAKTKAVEQKWEDDFDNDDDELGLISGSKRLTLSPSKKHDMPDADVLDNLAFEDLDEDKEATLKAGATIKALLPPPRPKPTVQPKPSVDEVEDLDTDFAIPLSLTHLTLAAIPTSPRYYKSRPRDSGASTHASWESPSTSASGQKSQQDWSDDSPAKKKYETSGTSISDSLDHGGKDEKDPGAEEDEDMEAGLIIPTATFFSNSRAKELNSLLDRKRKPQYAPLLTGPSTHARDESFEDGIVLDNPKVELSNHRLSKSRKARIPVGQGTIKNAPRSVAKEREKAWEKEREHGWGRPSSPLPSGSLGRGALPGLSGLRSHSASTSTTLRDVYKESPIRDVHQRDSVRSRSHASHLASTTSARPNAMLPPPVPSTQTPSRLRHQKSHYHIQPPQSPSLSRKQSLASLQDALIEPPLSDTHSPLETIHPAPSYTAKQSHSTSSSRLTMPTSSSKAKARQPVQSIFPQFVPSSSISSMTSAASGQIQSVKPRVTQTPRLMEIPKRRRVYGDGTELEGIEDLSVDRDKTSLGLGRPTKRPEPTMRSNSGTKIEPGEKRKKSSVKRTRSKPALLIKHLGGVDKRKVVGEMTWNPQTLRWEGNEACLRDFDGPLTASVRPALIAHYTGSSVGAGSGLLSPTLQSTSSLSAGLAATVRIVGDMKFDPEKMCWVSILDPEDDEPDPFEGMADDEDDEGGAGGTITRANARKLVSIGQPQTASIVTSSAWSSRIASETASTLSASIGSWGEQPSSSSSGRQSFGSTDSDTKSDSKSNPYLSDELWAECRAAEERHKKEIRGWLIRPSGNVLGDLREKERREEKRLWEIRHLAMRS